MMEKTTDLVLKLANGLNNTEYGKRIVDSVFSEAYRKGMFTTEMVDGFKEKFLIKFLFFCCHEDQRIAEIVSDDLYNALKEEAVK